jgi:hypothetical protein
LDLTVFGPGFLVVRGIGGSSGGPNAIGDISRFRRFNSRLGRQIFPFGAATGIRRKPLIGRVDFVAKGRCDKEIGEISGKIGNGPRSNPSSGVGKPG